jgi:hypothetical protein
MFASCVSIFEIAVEMPVGREAEVWMTPEHICGRAVLGFTILIGQYQE